VREVHLDGTATHLMVEGSPADLLAVAAPYRITAITTHEPDLEEIFLRYYGQA
jgi:hypothetical protein